VDFFFLTLFFLFFFADDNIYISQSYDATTHFESTVDDVLDIYKRIFDKDLKFEEPSQAQSEE